VQTHTQADLKRKLQHARADLDAALATAQRAMGEALQAGLSGRAPKEAARQLQARLEAVEAALPRGLRSLSEAFTAALQVKADRSAAEELPQGVAQVGARAAAAETAAATAAEAAAAAEHVAGAVAAALGTAGSRGKQAPDGPVSGWMQAPLWTAAVETRARASRVPSQVAAKGEQQQRQQAAAGLGAGAVVPVATREASGRGGAPGQQQRSAGCAPLSGTLATGAATTPIAPAPPRGGAARNARRAHEEAQRERRLRVLSAPLRTQLAAGKGGAVAPPGGLAPAGGPECSSANGGRPVGTPGAEAAGGRERLPTVAGGGLLTCGSAAGAPCQRRGSDCSGGGGALQLLAPRAGRDNTRYTAGSQSAGAALPPSPVGGDAAAT
jgi:hypothetical protein